MAGAPFATKAELVLTRTFDAPRELVFRAWSDPKHLAQWWGPRGFTTEIGEMEVRRGGASIGWNQQFDRLQEYLAKLRSPGK